MTYEEFVKFVQDKCLHETIYEDGEGRSILVITLLDAYGMANKLASVEREACAQLAENMGPCGFTGESSANAIRSRGQA